MFTGNSCRAEVLVNLLIHFIHVQVIVPLCSFVLKFYSFLSNQMIVSSQKVKKYFVGTFCGWDLDNIECQGARQPSFRFYVWNGNWPTWQLARIVENKNEQKLPLPIWCTTTFELQVHWGRVVQKWKAQSKPYNSIPRAVWLAEAHKKLLWKNCV